MKFRDGFPDLQHGTSQNVAKPYHPFPDNYERNDSDGPVTASMRQLMHASGPILVVDNRALVFLE